jgi:hypothetical protein
MTVHKLHLHHFKMSSAWSASGTNIRLRELKRRSIRP